MKNKIWDIVGLSIWAVDLIVGIIDVVNGRPVSAVIYFCAVGLCVLFYMERLVVKSCDKFVKSETKHGFYITDEERKDIEQWMEQHNKDCHGTGSVGDQYSYSFVPTTLGVLGVIKCGCGEQHVFRDVF